MKLWNKIKCIADYHGGEYSSVEGKAKCNLEKTCPNCNKYMTKIEHKMSPWKYLSEEKCDAVSHCIYCNYEVNELRHIYNEVKEKNECTYVDTCNRCGDKTIQKKATSPHAPRDNAYKSK